MTQHVEWFSAKYSRLRVVPTGTYIGQDSVTEPYALVVSCDEAGVIEGDRDRLLTLLAGAIEVLVEAVAQPQDARYAGYLPVIDAITKAVTARVPDATAWTLPLKADPLGNALVYAKDLTVTAASGTTTLDIDDLDPDYTLFWDDLNAVASDEEDVLPDLQWPTAPAASASDKPIPAAIAAQLAAIAARAQERS